MVKISKPYNIEPYSLAETIDGIDQIPFGKLIGNILSACVDAQGDAANVAWEYTKQVLKRSEAPMVFTYQDAEKLRRIEVPLITIVPLPYMRLDDIDLDFDATVNVTNKSKEFVVKTNSMQSSSSTVETEQSMANMHININAGTSDMPAGLASLLNFINDGIVIEDKIVPEIGKIYHGKIIGKYSTHAVVELFPNTKGVLDSLEIDWDWRRCKTMKDTGLNIGDKIDVKILYFDERTGEPHLSHRVLSPKPSDYISVIIKDAVYHGRVSSIMKNEAYVEILPDQLGVLPITEYDWRTYNSMKETGLKKDQDLDVKLIKIDKKNNKIQLSRKALIPQPPVSSGSKPPVSSGSKPPVSSGSKPPVSSGSKPPVSSGSKPPVSSGSRPWRRVPFAEDIDYGSVRGIAMNIHDNSEAAAIRPIKGGTRKSKQSAKVSKATKPMKTTRAMKVVEIPAYNGDPLLALHVTWTRPALMGNPNWKYGIDDFEILSTVLSALLWRKFNGPIKLYTDKEGLEFYNNLGMTELWNGGIDSTTLPRIPQTIPADIFWAGGKFYAIRKEEVPFVIMDTDLMVWDSIASYIKGNKLMAYHPEELYDFYLPYEDLKKPENYTLNKKWDWTLNPYNTALTYYANDELTAKFKKDYVEKAIKFMTNNTERPNDMVSQMVFAEQRLFSMIAKLHVGYPVPTFLNYPDEQGKPFTHLWGSKNEARTDNEAQHNLCVALGQALLQNFPDVHVSDPIEDILQKYCKR